MTDILILAKCIRTREDRNKSDIGVTGQEKNGPSCCEKRTEGNVIKESTAKNEVFNRSTLANLYLISRSLTSKINLALPGMPATPFLP